MMRIVDQYVVALLLLWSGAGKAYAFMAARRTPDVAAAQGHVGQMPFRPVSFVLRKPFLSAGISIWELMLAVLLVSAIGHSYQRWAAGAAALTFAAFAVSLLPAARQRTQVRCNCFGSNRIMPGTWALARAVVLGAAVTAVCVSPPGAAGPAVNAEAAALAVTLISIVVVAGNTVLLFTDTTRRLQRAGAPGVPGSFTEE